MYTFKGICFVITLYEVKNKIFVVLQVFSKNISVFPCECVTLSGFTELLTQTDSRLPMCQINFRIPVQGMLFGRKLGLQRLVRAAQLFYSFERSCFFQRLCHLHQCFKALALFRIWEAFLVSLSCHLLLLGRPFNH